VRRTPPTVEIVGEALTEAVARTAAVLTVVAVLMVAVVVVPTVAVGADPTAAISAARVLAGGCQRRQSKEVAAHLEVLVDLALVLRAMAVSSGIVEWARIGPIALHQL
jgi:hypothetical protein